MRMRIAFLLLVLANFVFFAHRYYVTQYAVPDFDPVAQQLHPERIRVISPEELGRLAGSRRSAVCLEIGPLATGEVARAEDAVAALGAGLKVARRVEEPSRWWVYIPPLPTRQAAVERVGELKKQGVEDSLLLSDDPLWRNGISLGVFRSEEAANNRAESLRKRGVRGLQVAAREGPGGRVYLQLRDAPEAVRLRFVDLRDGFPGSDVRDCPSG
jgi:hypothetical protein